MSSAPPHEVSAAHLLERLPRLYAATGQASFAVELEGILECLLDSSDASLFAIEGDYGSLVRCARIPGVSERLTPPSVPVATLRNLLGHPPRQVMSYPEGACELEVDEAVLPVVGIWDLEMGGRSAGFLVFHTPCERLSEVAADIFDQLRHNLAAALFQLAEAHEAAEHLDVYQAKLETINEVGELLGTLDVNVLLAKLMEVSLYVVNAQVGSIVLADQSETRKGIEWGLPLEMARRFKHKDGQVAYERVMETGEPALVLGFGASSEYRVEGLEVQVGCYLCIPLVSRNRTLGVINLVNPAHENSHFSELDRDLLMTISGLAATSLANAFLHEDSLEKERYRQSLAIAQEIQGNLYPSSAPKIPGLDIGWSNESCDETGGDYFDFISTGDDDLTVVVGDVSGHGIGAALLMASARASLRATLSESKELSPVICKLNDQLEQDMELDRFMTLVVAHLDPDVDQISFVNAGHDSPLIYRADTFEVEELPTTGMPLGIFAGNQFETGHAPSLRPGDVMLITTDGVWEVNDADGVMLGKERLKEIFRSHANNAAQEVITRVMEDVRQFTGDGPAHDDVTLVALRALPAGEA